jgi:hypothetical protein
MPQRLFTIFMASLDMQRCATTHDNTNPVAMVVSPLCSMQYQQHNT